MAELALAIVAYPAVHFCRLFLFFDSLPLLGQDFVAPVLIARLAEYMRVSPQHLVGYTLRNVSEIELSLFLGDTGMEDNVEQQIAKLLLDVLGIVTFDCIDQFVGFIQGMTGDGLAGLANIPGTAIFRIPQIHHNLQQVFDCAHQFYCV